MSVGCLLLCCCLFFKQKTSDELLISDWSSDVCASDLLAICRAAGGRVISLHSRRAAGEVLDASESIRDAGTPILHWFSGTGRQLDRAIDLGCWFSVGPAMLRTEKGRQLAARMPRDRLLTESDGPFAQIEGRSAWPWEAGHAISQLAAAWGEQDEHLVETQLLRNLKAIGRASASILG